jgi:antitoxin (DNA-binding transcriptional repressor) of toxin-antitoxin stability system
MLTGHLAAFGDSHGLVSMRAVGIKVLKNKLSEYVRLAAAGEIVLVTDRDRIVAELRAPSTHRAEKAPGALLADSVRRGLITPAALPPGPPPATVPVSRLEDILAALDDARRGR